MKTDDDCFVDVPKVLALLREKENKEKFVHGTMLSIKTTTRSKETLVRE